ncbi:hypothetical protein PIB30_018665 [Stylosanthes scabra]|uniref:Uncharacterized protein n=1 Tax=Stylosanthes scabra TaxID=79078 RepID=A0ABU6V9K2_9FABA|nr:hypothetical protein [Stylosanthes scabra]
MMAVGSNEGLKTARPNTWFKREQKLHTVFVDNLLERVIKGAMFYTFGFHGYVVDAFISRKKGIRLKEWRWQGTSDIWGNHWRRRSAEVNNIETNGEKIIGAVEDVDEGSVRREVEGFKWSSSRRVRPELIGLSIHVWSKDTFNRIAKRLDGKLVMQHYPMEEGASFSVARILIDCFRWEPIQERVAVKCEDFQFQIYVKEFGADVISVQVHPEESSKPSESCSTCRSVEAMHGSYV